MAFAMKETKGSTSNELTNEASVASQATFGNVVRRSWNGEVVVLNLVTSLIAFY